MRLGRMWIVPMGLMLLSASGSPADKVDSKDPAVAAIKKLGGKVELDQKSPNRAVISVILTDTVGIPGNSGNSELEFRGHTT